MHLIPIPPGMETRFFVMARGALREAPELLQCAFPEKQAWLIADENTWHAAGETLCASLREAGIPLLPPRIFPAKPKPHPDYAISCELAEKMTDTIVPVVVGSGVLNDLVKCAAGRAGIPYCCVATAPSVDGYTSNGGAMSVDGMKKTVPSPAPCALLADIDVLESAPPEMMASGYADLLTKIPAGADWRIADALGEEPIVPSVWNMVQKDLRHWISDCRNLKNLFAGLSATGYAMQVYHDSRPASGAEHLMSHIWEMEALSFRGEEVSHGFKVGIGTVAVVRLMEWIENIPADEAQRLARPPETREEREKTIAILLQKGCYGNGIPDVALKKFREGRAAQERRNLIWQKWPLIQQELKAQLLPLKEILRLLQTAGAPVRYSDIGLSHEQYLHGIRTAQLIRKRYTVLDLLYEAGLLSPALLNLTFGEEREG